MRFSFFSLAAATVCLTAGAFAAPPSAAAAESAVSAAAAERSIAASAPSSVASMQSVPSVQSNAHLAVEDINIEDIEGVDAHTMESIQRAGVSDILKVVISLVALILKGLIGTIGNATGLSLTDDQIVQVQQQALEQIDAMGGAEALEEIMRVGGVQTLVRFLLSILVPIIKELFNTVGNITDGIGQ
ncbi:hypothetical protein K492DRAFT_179984 [Lichtheimia hyalospora FSU 10163]|nr:hypothetical protein K492DRAFT_179984 [Lichtheimia hyalospora FSU 10163]